MEEEAGHDFISGTVQPLKFDDVEEKQDETSSDVTKLTKEEELTNLSNQDISEPPLSFSNVECSQNYETSADENHKKLTSENREMKRLSHSCSVCGKLFRRRVNLAAHLQAHEPKTPYSCFKCKKIFQQELLLCYHLSSRICDKYKCFMCGEKFRYKKTLDSHHQIHKTGKTLKHFVDGNGPTEDSDLSPPAAPSATFPRRCVYCDKRCRHQGEYERHLRVHAGESPYVCLHCYARFPCKEDLLKHGTVHTRGGGGILCEHCGKMFQNISNLKRHNFAVHSLKEKSCDKCGKNFDSKDSLLGHMRLHDSTVPFFCYKCQKLVQHKNSSKGHCIEDEICSCHVCEYDCHKKEIMSSNSENFAESSQPVLPLACSGNSSTSPINDQIVKKHVCLLCEKSFAEAVSLSNHVKTHYQCMKCKKIFKTKEDLETHLLFLGGEKLLTCFVCESVLHGEREFERHVSGHIKRKQHGPFVQTPDKVRQEINSKSRDEAREALIRMKASNEEPKVKIHMVTHAGKNSFKCSQCGKKVPVRHNLQDHMKNDRNDTSGGLPDSGEEFVIISRFRHPAKNQREMTDSYCTCSHNIRKGLTNNKGYHPKTVLVPYQKKVGHVGKQQRNECTSQAKTRKHGIGSLLASTSKDSPDVACKKSKHDNEVLRKVDDIKVEPFDSDIIIKEEWDITWC